MKKIEKNKKKKVNVKRITRISFLQTRDRNSFIEICYNDNRTNVYELSSNENGRIRIDNTGYDIKRVSSHPQNVIKDTRLDKSIWTSINTELWNHYSVPSGTKKRFETNYMKVTFKETSLKKDNKTNKSVAKKKRPTQTRKPLSDKTDALWTSLNSETRRLQKETSINSINWKRVTVEQGYVYVSDEGTKIVIDGRTLKFVNEKIRVSIPFPSSIAVEQEELITTIRKQITNKTTDTYLPSKSGKQSEENNNNNNKITNNSNNYPVRHLGEKDFVVYSNILRCRNKKHIVEDILGKVKLFTIHNREIEYTFHGVYCEKCNVCFILRDDFEKIRNIGVPCCHIESSESYYSRLASGNRWESGEYVLSDYGYNVRAIDNIPEEERHLRLRQVIRYGILSASEVKGKIILFRSSKQGLPNYQNAIKKWNRDIDFIDNLKDENKSIANVKAIKNKEYKTK